MISLSLWYSSELRGQLKEVKADIAKSTKEQVTTTCLREEMNKQAAQILETVQSEVNKQAAQIQQTVQSDLSSQSEVVKELQSEVRSIAAHLGEVKDMLQRVLPK